MAVQRARTKNGTFGRGFVTNVKPVWKRTSISRPCWRNSTTECNSYKRQTSHQLLRHNSHHVMSVVYVWKAQRQSRNISDVTITKRIPQEVRRTSDLMLSLPMINQEEDPKRFQRNPYHHNFIYTLVLFVFSRFVKSSPAQVTLFFYPSTSPFFNFSSVLESSTLGLMLHIIPTFSCETVFVGVGYPTLGRMLHTIPTYSYYTNLFMGLGYIREFLFQNHPT